MSYLVFQIKPLASISFTFATSSSCTVYLTASLLTKLFGLLKSTATVFSFSISILSISAFSLAKFDFNSRLDVSIPVAFFNLAFVR